MIVVSGLEVPEICDSSTYATDDCCTASTFRDHVSSALTRLAIVAGPSCLFQRPIIPVAGSGSISKGLVSIDRQVLVGTVQRRSHEDSAILKQGDPDLTAGTGQVVERVQINGGGNAYDDTDEAG